jgi:hypothetical protein
VATVVAVSRGRPFGTSEVADDASELRSEVDEAVDTATFAEVSASVGVTSSEVAAPPDTADVVAVGEAVVISVCSDVPNVELRDEIDAAAVEVSST